MASINSQRAPSSTVTFLLGIVCLAVFATIIVAWTKAKAPKTDLVEAERGDARLKKRLELEKEADVKLRTVAWINKEKGEVQVPIAEAIKAVAGELKGKKIVKSEVKVPAPALPPVIDPKSTEPPPQLLPSAPQGADLINFTTQSTPEASPAPAVPAPAVPSAPVPAPTAPPAPAIPSAAPAVVNPAAAVEPSRPPLINWTESK